MRRVFYEGRPQNDGQLYWFQDNRTGCEKQTVYFERIRQLESELITKEQKHLVSALERLKQLRYPRRKPVVLDKNWERGPMYQQKSRSDKFEERAIQSKKLPLSLNAKQMEICAENKNDRANLRPKIESPYRSVRPLKDNTITPSNEQHTSQLYFSAANFSDGINIKPYSRKAPMYDVFFPSIPCIPNAGHRTNIEIENRLRILELANGEFQKFSNGSSRSRKRMAIGRYNHRSTGGLAEENASNQSDNPAPVLAAIFDETPSEEELNKSSYEDSVKQQEIRKSETQTKNVECDSSNARQPPPTRRNSHKSTSDSKDSSSDPVHVAIKTF